jgi:hypothetical protein
MEVVPYSNLTVPEKIQFDVSMINFMTHTLLLWMASPFSVRKRNYGMGETECTSLSKVLPKKAYRVIKN